MPPLAYLSRGGILFSVKIRYSFILLSAVSILFFEHRMIFHALICILLHEAGHVICAKAFGCSINTLELCAQGLTIDLDRLPNPLQNIIIIAFGPLVNLLCSLIYITLFDNIDPYFVGFNLSFGIFNLIPLKFLDGGRLLEQILSLSLSSHLCSRICFWINTVLLIITWCLSIYCFLFESTHSSSMFICLFSLINLCLDV